MAERLFSVSSLKAPQLDASAGIWVCSSHAPFTNRKKSSCGRTARSKFVVSTPSARRGVACCCWAEADAASNADATAASGKRTLEFMGGLMGARCSLLAHSLHRYAPDDPFAALQSGFVSTD